MFVKFFSPIKSYIILICLLGKQNWYQLFCNEISKPVDKKQYFIFNLLHLFHGLRIIIILRYYYYVGPGPDWKIDYLPLCQAVRTKQIIYQTSHYTTVRLLWVTVLQVLSYFKIIYYNILVLYLIEFNFLNQTSWNNNFFFVINCIHMMPASTKTYTLLTLWLFISLTLNEMKVRPVFVYIPITIVDPNIYLFCIFVPHVFGHITNKSNIIHHPHNMGTNLYDA